MTTLDTCYSDPLSVDPNWLCLLFLVLAIGLVMAAPSPGTREDAIIQKLKGERADRAEVFYLDAKHLKDPSAGFEDAGFWSIQALTLMAVYNLAVSKRNAAYAFYGEWPCPSNIHLISSYLRHGRTFCFRFRPP
jgi:hypothetical protein